MIDFKSSFGRKANHRLRQSQVIWLVTTDAVGRPQPRPVWYDWDGETFLVLSEPSTGKVRHVLERPRVALHLNTDPSGDEVTVLLGEAKVLNHEADKARLKRYLRKYRQGIKHIGQTPATFFERYHVPIIITPTTLRGA